MTTPHPLLGVPVVFLAGDRWVSGAVTNVVNHTVSIRQHASPCASLTYPFSDEGTTWRRAGVEYPAKVPVPSPPSEMKRLAQAARAGYRSGKPDNEAWEDAASAVIAAYEAGRKTETVTRWAVRWFDGDGNPLWWTGGNWSTTRCLRALYGSSRIATSFATNDGSRIVKVTTRRRVKVKP